MPIQTERKLKVLERIQTNTRIGNVPVAEIFNIKTKSFTPEDTAKAKPPVENALLTVHNTLACCYQDSIVGC